MRSAGVQAISVMPIGPSTTSSSPSIEYGVAMNELQPPDPLIEPSANSSRTSEPVTSSCPDASVARNVRSSRSSALTAPPDSVVGVDVPGADDAGMLDPGALDAGTLEPVPAALDPGDVATSGPSSSQATSAV